MFNIPNLHIVKQFLVAKGWHIQAQDERFQYFAPPSQLTFSSSNFQYALPLTDTPSDYAEYMHRLIASIAEVYDLNKWYLHQLFGQSLEELRKDIELKNAILAA